MIYAVGKHFDKFIREQVSMGRYNNASEVIREGLRLMEDREAKLNALRKNVNTVIERGGNHSDEEVAKILSADTME